MNILLCLTLTCLVFTVQGSLRPPENERLFVSPVIDAKITEISSKLKDKTLASLFDNCFPNTLDTTVHFDETAKKTYIITGDIDAMWLRDSTNQVWPYIQFAKEEGHLANMISGLVATQASLVNYDPYANAFNRDTTGHIGSWQGDATFKRGFMNTRVPAMTSHLHERKFEIDSLLAFLKLSRAYFNVTSDKSIFTTEWIEAVSKVLEVFEDQQKGSDEQSTGGYFFQRTSPVPTDTLQHGVGPASKRTGMLKSPFRPSDDATTFQFLVPANAMAVVELGYIENMLKSINQTVLATKAGALAAAVQAGINAHAVINHPTAGKIMAYEVDGYGSYLASDDANVPSLLSLPYLGYCKTDDALYVNTRKFVLSKQNPYYFVGSAGTGVGSPHIGFGSIWPMSIIMQAQTSTDDTEILSCLEILKKSAFDGFMHESFSKDNVQDYTRPWFAWVNSMYGDLIIHLSKTKPHLIF